MNSQVPNQRECLKKLALFTALSAVAALTGNVNAQQRQQEASSPQESLIIPGDEGLLEVSVDAPAEARVGESYEMQVAVKNTSGSIVLHDIELTASTSGPIDIESSQMGQDEEDGESSGDEKENANSDSDGKEKSQSSNSGGDSGEKSWTIKELKPGETKRLMLTAVGDEESDGSLCLSVVSYRRSLCVATRITKPELKLTKQAPEEASLCEVVHIVYSVTNDGSGGLGPFTIEDPLSDGLQTESGEQKLKFEVDGLEAGETRKFEADLMPVKRGEFSSRAVAKVQDSDIQNQSEKVTTKVVGPELAVAIDGADMSYGDRPIDYTVRITNTGNMALNAGRLVVTYPTSAEFSQQSDFETSDRKVSAGSQESDSSQTSDSQNGDSEAKSQEGETQEGESQEGSNGNGSNASEDSQQNTDQVELELPNLEPGETVKTMFVLRGADMESVKVTAKALFDCGIGDSGAKTSSVAHTETRIASLSALLLTVVDEQDPVRVGEDVNYIITVRNQGNAIDENVGISVELPEALNFQEAGGATSAKNVDGKVTFEKVSKIEPGQKLEWNLRATAESEGDLRLTVTLDSDGLDESVETQEPTKLFGSDSEQSN